MPGEAEVLELIGQRLRLGLTDAEPAMEGQRRTFYARVAGEPVVVKWGLDPDLPEKIPYVAGQVPELLSRDCPVPRILAHAPLGRCGYGWVQERLAGTPATVLDDVLLADLVDLIGRLAEAPPGPHRNDMAYWVPAAVFGDEAGWWRTAAAMSPQTASFCRRLRAWAGRPPRGRESRHDYVHGDLNLSNVLISGGRLTGVIDTEIMGVGDRAIDLARLAFEWHWLARAGTPGLAAGALSRLTALGQEFSSAAGWRVAVAYDLVSRLGWRSEHYGRLDPDTLPACVEFLDAIG
jgi:aminoglycoside phosphotransferase (APT) family kinase protein